MSNDYTIGIIGGMGSYATVDFFRRLVDAFPAAKEWERPRILIDNRCTMPSRVRAILYGERREELVEDLSDSAIQMLQGGVSRIILACNTSHVFLPEVEKSVPECRGKFLDIISCLGKELFADGIKEITLLASEGTIQTDVYGTHFSEFGIKLVYPSEDEFSLLRGWIEAVKQNHFEGKDLQSFREYADSCRTDSLILGCTELPILYLKAQENGWKPKKKIYDPLQSVIEVVKKEYKEL